MVGGARRRAAPPAPATRRPRSARRPRPRPPDRTLASPIARRSCGPPPAPRRSGRPRAAATSLGRSDASAPTSGARPASRSTRPRSVRRRRRARGHRPRSETSLPAGPRGGPGSPRLTRGRPRCARASPRPGPRPPDRPQRRTNRAPRRARRCAAARARPIVQRARRPRQSLVGPETTGKTALWSGRRRPCTPGAPGACGPGLRRGRRPRRPAWRSTGRSRSGCRRQPRRRCRRGSPVRGALRRRRCGLVTAGSPRPGPRRRRGTRWRARAGRSSAPASSVRRSPRASRICHCTRSMPGHHLRDGMLHLQARVHLEEVETTVLDRAGIPRSPRSCSRPTTPAGRPRASSASRNAGVTAGDGVSSTSF